MTKEYFYFDCDGPNKVGLKKGFNKILDLCPGNDKKFLFAFEDKSFLSKRVIRKVFLDIAPILHDYKSLTMQNEIEGLSINFTLFTKEDHPDTWDSVILAVYVKPDTLAKLDQYDHKGIIVIPWLKNDVKDWIEEKQAKKLSIFTKTPKKAKRFRRKYAGTIHAKMQDPVKFNE